MKKITDSVGKNEIITPDSNDLKYIKATKCLEKPDIKDTERQQRRLVFSNFRPDF